MKQLLFIIFLVNSIPDFILAQTRVNVKLEKNRFSLSIPVIFNTTEVTYYITGNSRQATSTTFSYGVNLSYSRTFFEGLGISAGVGYFKQRFTNQRPFNYAYDSRP